MPSRLTSLLLSLLPEHLLIHVTAPLTTIETNSLKNQINSNDFNFENFVEKLKFENTIIN